MLDLPSVRTYRLSRGGVECDEQGLRLGGLPLLARDGRGAWKARDERELGRDLSHVYGFRVAAGAKMAGFGVVAKSLQDGNLVKAQVAALLLRLPDPPSRTDAALGKSAERRLYCDLVASGLLKADADWDEKHPRTGAPPECRSCPQGYRCFFPVRFARRRARGADFRLPQARPERAARRGRMACDGPG